MSDADCAADFWSAFSRTLIFSEQYDTADIQNGGKSARICWGAVRQTLDAKCGDLSGTMSKRLADMAKEAGVDRPERFASLGAFGAPSGLPFDGEEEARKRVEQTAKALHSIEHDAPRIADHFQRLQSEDPAGHARGSLRRIAMQIPSIREGGKRDFNLAMTGRLDVERANEELREHYATVAPLAEAAGITLPCPWLPERITDRLSWQQGWEVLRKFCADVPAHCPALVPDGTKKAPGEAPPDGSTKNGPYAAGRFHWNGEDFELTNKPWRVLELMWLAFPKRSRSFEEIAEAIYPGVELDPDKAKYRIKPFLTAINNALDGLTGFQHRLGTLGADLRWEATG